MKKSIILILAFGLFVANIYGSPLVFTVTKEFDTKESYVELATFDATKFKQIRIIVVLPGTAPASGQGIEFYAVVYAVEGSEEIYLPQNDDSVFESPPAKLRIKVKGSGKFTVYIWGQ